MPPAQPASVYRYRSSRDMHKVLPPRTNRTKGEHVIILGAILLILGFILDIPILWTIGIVLLVVGVILYVLGAAGRTIGGRKHWF